MYGHHISNFLNIYLAKFRLNFINNFKNSTNIEKFGHMEYICDKIISIIKFENLHTYISKLGLWKFFDEFFMMYDIGIH